MGMVLDISARTDQFSKLVLKFLTAQLTRILRHGRSYWWSVAKSDCAFFAGNRDPFPFFASSSARSLADHTTQITTADPSLPPDDKRIL